VEELELGFFAPLGQDGLRLSGQQRGCCIPDLEAELTQQLELRLRLAQGALRQLPPARIRRPGALLRG
jgi:hypothetical protein